MQTQTIVIVGTPTWVEEAAQLLSQGYSVKHYIEQTDYVTRLADDRAVLVLVDGDDSGWRFWTTTPKVSPATRRIPILLISADESVRAEALSAGADLTLALAELAEQLPGLARDYARVLSADALEQLDCDCGEPLPAMGREGVEKFNAGEYYKQHDLFEALWVQTESPVRDLYRAVLQVGVAYYQITRGNHRGALKMLLRSVQWLSMLPDTCQGIDVKQLREDSYRARAALEAMKPEDIGSFDRSLLKPVRFTPFDHS